MPRCEPPVLPHQKKLEKISYLYEELQKIIVSFSPMITNRSREDNLGASPLNDERSGFHGLHER